MDKSDYQGRNDALVKTIIMAGDTCVTSCVWVL